MSIKPNFSVRIDPRREPCFDSGIVADEYYSILEQAQAIPSLVMSNQGHVHQTQGHRRALTSYCALGMDTKGRMTRQISVACPNINEFTGVRRQKDGRLPSDEFTTPLYDPGSLRSDPMEIVELTRAMVWKHRGEFEHMQLIAAGHGRRILICVKNINTDHLIVKIMMQVQLSGSQQPSEKLGLSEQEKILQGLLTNYLTRSERSQDCVIMEAVRMNTTAGVDEFALAILAALSLAMCYNLIRPGVHFWLDNMMVAFSQDGQTHRVQTTLKFQHRMQYSVPFENHDKNRLEGIACPSWHVELNQPSLVDDEIEGERMLPALSTPVRESQMHVQRTTMWDCRAI